jgi:hypothetical protein
MISKDIHMSTYMYESMYYDDDDVYLIENDNMAVGYKIYLHTEPSRTAKYKVKSIRAGTEMRMK